MTNISIYTKHKYCTSVAILNIYPTENWWLYLSKPSAPLDFIYINYRLPDLTPSTMNLVQDTLIFCSVCTHWSLNARHDTAHGIRKSPTRAAGPSAPGYIQCIQLRKKI